MPFLFMALFAVPLFFMRPMHGFENGRGQNLMTGKGGNLSLHVDECPSPPTHTFPPLEMNLDQLNSEFFLTHWGLGGILAPSHKAGDAIDTPVAAFTCSSETDPVQDYNFLVGMDFLWISFVGGSVICSSDVITSHLASASRFPPGSCFSWIQSKESGGRVQILVPVKIRIGVWLYPSRLGMQV